ncbi:MAG: hypothetical protein ACO1OD_10070 [Croceibacterium sp.]
MTFDMNRTWDEALALVRGNFQLLGVIAGVFLLLPTVVFYLGFPEILVPPPPDQELSNDEALALAAKLFPAVILMILVQMVGYLAMIALIGGARPTVGEAIGSAIKALPTLLATFVTLFAIGLLGGVLLTILLALIVAGLALVLGEGALIGLSILIYIVLIGVMFYAYARISPLLPIIAIERARGFVQPLKRAWSLTRGAGRRLFAFFALLFVAYIVISMVAGIVLQALGLLTPEAMTGGGVLAFALVASVIAALLAMLMSGFLVSIHRQLAGKEPVADEKFDA